MKLLVTKPADFFAEAEPAASYKPMLLFVVPPVLIFSAGTAVLSRSWLNLATSLALASICLALWTAALKFGVLIFGEKRSWVEALQISACASLPVALGWIPYVGLPAAAVGTGYLSYLGLVHHFKMNQGAAMAAVSLPVVICGLGGTVLSFLLLALASISTMFSH